VNPVITFEGKYKGLRVSDLSPRTCAWYVVCLNDFSKRHPSVFKACLVRAIKYLQQVQAGEVPAPKRQAAPTKRSREPIRQIRHCDGSIEHRSIHDLI
jgi:hypothetical protein